MQNNILLQQEPFECALACLGMILNYYKSNISLQCLRNKFYISPRGTSIATLIQYAKKFHFDTNVYWLKHNQIKTLKLPAILYWNQNHFVVFKKFSKNKGYLILDPAKGKYWIDSNKLSKRFTKFAIEITPNKYYQRVKISFIKDFFYLLKKIPKLMKFIASSLIINLLIQISIFTFPLYLQKTLTINTYHATSIYLTLNLLIILILLKISEALLSFTNNFNSLIIEKYLLKKLTKIFYFHLFKLPIKQLNKFNSKIKKNIFMKINEIKNILSQCLIHGFIATIFSIISLIFIYNRNSIIGITVILFTIIYISINFLFLTKLINLFKIQKNQSLVEKYVLYENIDKIKSIKLFNQENNIYQKWRKKFKQTLKSSNKINLIQSTLACTRIALFGAQTIICTYICAKLLKIKSIALADCYTMIFYLNLYTKNLSNLTKKWFDFIKLTPDIFTLINSLKFNKTKQKKYYSNLSEKNSKNIISIKNISFRYNIQSPWLIKNLNIDIPKNKTTIIFGPSGSGKTTLIKILLGLLEPTCGNIYYNYKNINPKKESQPHTYFTYILQNDQLFSGTIAENISFFNPNIDNHQLINCSSIANIHSDILKMPMEYQTYVDPHSELISTGQAQRILIARALYKNPQLIILDEGLSNIDTKNIKKIILNLKKFNLTKIIVTHSKELLKTADLLIDTEKILNNT